MGRRTKVGIFYNYSTDWMGGVYYIQNLISSLNYIDDSQKPELTIFCNDKKRYYELVAITEYPYMNFYPYRFDKSLVVRIINKISRTLFPYHYIPVGGVNVKKMDIDVFYPVNYEYVDNHKNSIAWIPDFQERYLPEYFSSKELKSRDNGHKRFYKNEMPIVFSSKDAEKDFKNFYPKAEVPTFVLNFAVKHPYFGDQNIDIIKEKFGIRKEYLFCANQFWMHKNHLFLFKAYLQAKNKGFDKQLVCSGKLSDYRNREYASQIRSFIRDNNLENDILLLGLIDRKEQLCLMKNSFAMIQPSLFEGWSTVVEDAKALNKFIFLSNLPVHKEQDPKNVCFFNPRSEEDFVKKLLTVIPTNIDENYELKFRNFGQTFIKIIESAKPSTI